MYIRRNIENLIDRCSKQFACITLYGSRQVGKSTVINKVFNDKYEHVSLDNLQNLNMALNNPKLFLETYKWPVVIDEIQRAPKLLSEIKIIIDKQKLEWLNKDEPIQLMYVLTGSNQFELQETISESLAGRTAVLHLASLSSSEIDGYNEFSLFNPDIDILKEKEKSIKPKYKTRKEIFESIYRGGMPEYISTRIDRDIFFSSYVATYIEKDIKKLIAVDKETTFLKFMEYIALRTGCQIEYSSIANALGIDTRTVKSWISILQTSGIIVLLEPYMKNVSDRIIKSPKLYFMDTGLCSYLCKWPNAEMLENGPMGGAIYETYVVSEIIKSYYNNGVDYRMYLYYYRDKDQKEVDLIIDAYNGIYPIEIKKGINPVSYNKNFNVLAKFKKPILKGLVIDSCERIMPVNENVYYCPVSMIGL